MTRLVELNHVIAAGMVTYQGLPGRVVLVHTGWDRHWRTAACFSGHPFLGFLFSAPPPRVRGMGTFPVRAHAILGSEAS